MKPKKALLVVDVQNDFCPGGALGIPGGDRLVPKLNKYIVYAKKKGWPVFASRDWHPLRSRHFKDFGGTWPVHCLQNSPGAAFHPRLKLPRDAILLYKGMDPDKDSYSVFQAEDEKGRPFLQVLTFMGIEELYVGGLATDYCVKSTVLDALAHKLKARVLMDAIQGVNLRPADTEHALKAMFAKGAKKILHVPA